jgi:holin-like protein
MRRLVITLRYRVHHSRLLQIALVFAFWLVGRTISETLHLPIPGGIVGMLIVLVLLASRQLSLFSMRRGAEWFLADMLLFFVPAVLAVLGHRELVGLLGLKILTVICVGTLTVMAVTALTVDLCYRWIAARESVRANGH